MGYRRSSKSASVLGNRSASTARNALAYLSRINVYIENATG
jgi:hypothetical protein